ncbi:MAG TPA: fused MFS/spermidine synthase [Candidatus Saccharimonadales bacterium]|nr:fused MFS/spermidine synthase [Candidatus Saccharimonadales bacterium]
MQYVRRHFLPVTVFITGACVLILEVAATRMLAPYFGNTIYTVSSVLSVVLAALSGGYYLGGKLADRQPSKQLFFGIIAFAGISVCFVQTAQVTLLPTLGQYVPSPTGPLLAATLLFFIPSFALGMLSPFAIKLADMQRGKQGIGSIAGKMFFFSTVGSIFGSLFAGFVLLPRVGVGMIIGVTGLLLIVLGLTPLLYLWRGGKRHIGAAILLIAALSFGAFVPQRQAKAVIYNKSGVYQQITISDGNEGGRPVRYLFQDNSLAGAMYLDTDSQLYSKYQDYYVLPEAMQQRTPKHVAIIGGGMYIAPRALIQNYPGVRVDAVEIEPSLPALAEQYFKLPETPRLTHHITDGRRFLHDTQTKYDMIYSDVYLSLYSTPIHFTTKEFFTTAYNALGTDGLFVANIIDSMANNDKSVLRAEVQTLQQVFPTVYVFATRAQTTSELQNFVVVGSKNITSVDFTLPQFANNRHKIVRDMAAAQVPITSLNPTKYPVLTDDFAPIDNWAADMTRRFR